MHLAYLAKCLQA